MHKGYTCLELKSGRVYISRDVIFDEHIFPFEDLHENAGAKLRQEILLLPQNLLPGLNAHHREETILAQKQNMQQEVQSEQGNNELGEPSSADRDLPGVQHQPASEGHVVPSSPARQPGNTNSISINASTLPAQARVDMEESRDNADAPAGAEPCGSFCATCWKNQNKIQVRYFKTKSLYRWQ
jgi:hypothetical protein